MVHPVRGRGAPAPLDRGFWMGVRASVQWRQTSPAPDGCPDTLHPLSNHDHCSLDDLNLAQREAVTGGSGPR